MRSLYPLKKNEHTKTNSFPFEALKNQEDFNKQGIQAKGKGIE